MRKTVIIGLLGTVALACGLSRGAVAQTYSSRHAIFPKACYFFVPTKQAESEERKHARVLDDERAYYASFAEVHRLWCTPGHNSLGARAAAADEMVKTWKTVWDRDDDAEFEETSAIDLLYLLGLTHQLPAQIVSDPEFTKEWIERCAESCFTIWSVPESPAEEHGLAMRLWLHSDLLDNLKREPASAPVIKMLQEAQYRLID